MQFNLAKLAPYKAITFRKRKNIFKRKKGNARNKIQKSVKQLIKFIYVDFLREFESPQKFEIIFQKNSIYETAGVRLVGVEGKENVAKILL